MSPIQSRPVSTGSCCVVGSVPDGGAAKAADDVAVEYMIETPIDVRMSLVDAFQIDLIGSISALGDHAAILPPSPSQWYLTGFLVPAEGQQGLEFEDG
jgi:hypothetical protein